MVLESGFVDRGRAALRVGPRNDWKALSKAVSRAASKPVSKPVSKGCAAIGLVLCLVVLSVASGGCASDSAAASPSDTAGAAEDGSGRLEPRYQPREPQPEPFYNNNYLFGMTRAVTGSTMHPGVKAPLLVLTVPLDLVFLPFAAIGGLFG